MSELLTPPPFLVGDRVYLRQLCLEDTTTLWNWINSSEVTIHLSVVFPITLKKETEFVESAIAEYDKQFPTKFIFGICLKETNELIGTMNLSSVHWVHRTATTGAFIGSEEHRNNGLGREAKHLLLKYGFRSLGLRKVSSGAKAVNERSLRYQASNGYKVVGHQRKHFLVDGNFVDLVLTEVFPSDWEESYQEWLQRAE